MNESQYDALFKILEKYHPTDKFEAMLCWMAEEPVAAKDFIDNLGYYLEYKSRLDNTLGV